MSNIISIFLLIASVGIFFGYINPTYGAVTGEQNIKNRSVQELWEESGRYTDALNKTREIEKARVGLLERYNAIPLEDRERLEKLLPDHIDSVRLIIDINNAAAQYGMTLKNINLTNADEGTTAGSVALGPQQKRFKPVGLKFNVSGSYDEFRSFVRDMEKSLRLVDVTGMTFTSNEKEYNFSVTISTYRLVVPK